MNSDNAFALIKDWLSSHGAIELCNEEFNNEAFGNFFITFKINGKFFSYVYDRGQLLLCNSRDGEGDCKLISENLNETPCQELSQICSNSLKGCIDNSNHGESTLN